MGVQSELQRETPRQRESVHVEGLDDSLDHVRTAVVFDEREDYVLRRAAGGTRRAGSARAARRRSHQTVLERLDDHLAQLGTLLHVVDDVLEREVPRLLHADIVDRAAAAFFRKQHRVEQSLLLRHRRFLEQVLRVTEPLALPPDRNSSQRCRR